MTEFENYEEIEDFLKKIETELLFCGLCEKIVTLQGKRDARPADEKVGMKYLHGKN